MGVDRKLTTHWLNERVMVCDGAMGTMLHATGVPLDQSLSELNVTRPDLVGDVHSAYAEAGARILQTNTFDANRSRLEAAGSSASVREVNIAGARLAREAARRAPGSVLVAGSVGPVIRPAHAGQLDRARRRSIVAEQVAALADWVDLVLLETYGNLTTLVEAIEVARVETDLPVVAQMTFSTDGRTLAGEDPATVAATLAELAPEAIGANCTVGPALLQEVVAELVGACDLPVTVQPNAGIPRQSGSQLTYANNADYFADAARDFVDAGAGVVGGCCGTTPAHVRAISRAVAERTPAPRPDPAAGTPRRPAPVVTLHPSTRPEDPIAWPRPGEFVVAAELAAPRGDDLPRVLARAEALTDAGVDMVAVADPAPPTPRGNPIAAAVLLRERVGVDVILTIETAERSLAALQADLLGVHALGIDVVVCRTGTPRVAGDYPAPDPLWDVDARRLVGTLSGLNQGVDWRGVTAPDRTRFVIGTGVHTAAADDPAPLDEARERVTAGAHFLLTDPVHDVDATARTLAALRSQVDVPVLAVLAPFDDHTEVARAAHEVPTPSAMSTRPPGEGPPPPATEDPVDEAVRTTEKLRHLVDGVLVRTPLGGGDRVADMVPALRSVGVNR